MPVPLGEPLPENITLPVSIKVGDNITTDHIMPAGAKVLPLRSNIPAISEFVFAALDADFAKRAKELGQSIIVGGQNYGQGSSREHAALAPMYLGVKLVIAQSFARIHKANLINFGILPLEFANVTDYDLIAAGDVLQISDLKNALTSGEVLAINISKGATIKLVASLTPRQIAIIKAGGLLAFSKAQALS